MFYTFAFAFARLTVNLMKCDVKGLGCRAVSFSIGKKRVYAVLGDGRILLYVL